MAKAKKPQVQKVEEIKEEVIDTPEVEELEIVEPEVNNEPEIKKECKKVNKIAKLDDFLS